MTSRFVGPLLLFTWITVPGAPVVAADGIDRLAWLAGCWTSERGDRQVSEMWMAPAGGSMLGMGRTMVRDTTREHESMRILLESGRLVFTATPSGQPTASFTASVLTDTSVVFENPTHDFPQRVLYTRYGPDSLVARIEGVRGGRARGIDFPMRRARCPGAR